MIEKKTTKEIVALIPVGQDNRVWVSMESLQQLLAIPPLQLLKKHKTDSYQQALSIELSEVGK